MDIDRFHQILDKEWGVASVGNGRYSYLPLPKIRKVNVDWRTNNTPEKKNTRFGRRL